MTLTRLRRICKENLPWVIIGIGIILRLRQYFFDRSLWLDEALLARNILKQSFVGLLQPLQYGQNAPIGFLLLSKLATLVGGQSSMALRFFPLVFGIIALFLFYSVAKRFLRTPGVLIALTFFTLSTPIIYYSTEFKQYMGDVFATLLLWYIFLVVRPKNKLWLIITGAVVIWFSHASMFILAALGAADTSLWLPVVPFWLMSFGINYVLALRFYLTPAFVGSLQLLFLAFPWQIKGGWNLFFLYLGRMLGFFVDVDMPWAQVAILLLGYVSIEMQKIRMLVVLFLPIILVLIASGFEKYPFVPRLLLFLAPSLYIAIGAGTDMIISWGRRLGGRIGAVLSAAILVPLVFWGTIPTAWHDFTTPIKVEEMQQVLSYLHTHYQPGDVIYVYYAAEAPFRFYAPQFGLDNVPYIVGISSRNNVLKYVDDLSQLKGNTRVWVVISHVYKYGMIGEDRFIAGYMDRIGKRLDYYPQVGASLYLYDLR